MQQYYRFLCIVGVWYRSRRWRRIESTHWWWSKKAWWWNGIETGFVFGVQGKSPRRLNSHISTSYNLENLKSSAKFLICFNSLGCVTFTVTWKSRTNSRIHKRKFEAYSSQDTRSHAAPHSWRKNEQWEMVTVLDILHIKH